MRAFILSHPHRGAMAREAEPDLCPFDWCAAPDDSSVKGKDIESSIAQAETSAKSLEEEAPQLTGLGSFKNTQSELLMQHQAELEELENEHTAVSARFDSYQEERLQSLHEQDVPFEDINLFVSKGIEHRGSMQEMHEAKKMDLLRRQSIERQYNAQVSQTSQEARTGSMSHDSQD
eukprot:2019020-Rhodomonas_salina.1